MLDHPRLRTRQSRHHNTSNIYTYADQKSLICTHQDVLKKLSVRLCAQTPYGHFTHLSNIWAYLRTWYSEAGLDDGRDAFLVSSVKCEDRVRILLATILLHFFLGFAGNNMNYDRSGSNHFFFNFRFNKIYGILCAESKTYLNFLTSLGLTTYSTFLT